jgi:hypothetical protein
MRQIKILILQDNQSITEAMNHDNISNSLTTQEFGSRQDFSIRSSCGYWLAHCPINDSAHLYITRPKQATFVSLACAKTEPSLFIHWMMMPNNSLQKSTK